MFANLPLTTIVSLPERKPFVPPPDTVRCACRWRRRSISATGPYNAQRVSRRKQRRFHLRAAVPESLSNSPLILPSQAVTALPMQSIASHRAYPFNLEYIATESIPVFCP